MITDVTNSTYNKIVLLTTTKCTNYENLPRKNSQKSADNKIEDSHPYIAKLDKNIPTDWVSVKTTGQFLFGGWMTC